MYLSETITSHLIIKPSDEDRAQQIFLNKRHTDLKIRWPQTPMSHKKCSYRSSFQNTMAVYFYRNIFSAVIIIVTIIVTMIIIIIMTKKHNSNHNGNHNSNHDSNHNRNHNDNNNDNIVNTTALCTLPGGCCLWCVWVTPVPRGEGGWLWIPCLDLSSLSAQPLGELVQKVLKSTMKPPI